MGLIYNQKKIAGAYFGGEKVNGYYNGIRVFENVPKSRIHTTDGLMYPIDDPRGLLLSVPDSTNLVFVSNGQTITLSKPLVSKAFIEATVLDDDISVGSRSFWGCSNLTYVSCKILGNPTNLPHSFLSYFCYQCVNLEYVFISFPQTIINYQDSAFYRIFAECPKFKGFLNKDGDTFRLPSHSVQVGGGAFMYMMFDQSSSFSLTSASTPSPLYFPPVSSGSTWAYGAYCFRGTGITPISPTPGSTVNIPTYPYFEPD